MKDTLRKIINMFNNDSNHKNPEQKVDNLINRFPHIHILKENSEEEKFDNRREKVAKVEDSSGPSKPQTFENIVIEQRREREAKGRDGRD